MKISIDKTKAPASEGKDAVCVKTIVSYPLCLTKHHAMKMYLVLN